LWLGGHGRKARVGSFVELKVPIDKFRSIKVRWHVHSLVSCVNCVKRGLGKCGVRWQTKCDTAFAWRNAVGRAKAPSPLRAAGALHKVCGGSTHLAKKWMAKRFRS